MATANWQNWQIRRLDSLLYLGEAVSGTADVQELGVFAGDAADSVCTEVPGLASCDEYIDGATTGPTVNLPSGECAREFVAAGVMPVSPVTQLVLGMPATAFYRISPTQFPFGTSDDVKECGGDVAKIAARLRSDMDEWMTDAMPPQRAAEFAGEFCTRLPRARWLMADVVDYLTDYYTPFAHSPEERQTNARVEKALLVIGQRLPMALTRYQLPVLAELKGSAALALTVPVTQLRSATSWAHLLRNASERAQDLFDDAIEAMRVQRQARAMFVLSELLHELTQDQPARQDQLLAYIYGLQAECMFELDPHREAASLAEKKYLILRRELPGDHIETMDALLFWARCELSQAANPVQAWMMAQTVAKRLQPCQEPAALSRWAKAQLLMAQACLLCGEVPKAERYLHKVLDRTVRAWPAVPQYFDQVYAIYGALLVNEGRADEAHKMLEVRIVEILARLQHGEMPSVEDLRVLLYAVTARFQSGDLSAGLALHEEVQGWFLNYEVQVKDAPAELRAQYHLNEALHYQAQAAGDFVAPISAHMAYEQAIHCALTPGNTLQWLHIVESAAQFLRQIPIMGDPARALAEWAYMTAVKGFGSDHPRSEALAILSAEILAMKRADDALEDEVV